MPFRPLFVDAEQSIRSKQPDRGYDRLQSRLADWGERFAAERDPHRLDMLEIEWKLLTMGRFPLWRG